MYIVSTGLTGNSLKHLTVQTQEPRKYAPSVFVRFTKVCKPQRVASQEGDFLSNGFHALLEAIFGQQELPGKELDLSGVARAT